MADDDRDSDELASVFVARLPQELREASASSPQLEHQLLELVRRARLQAPDVDNDARAFVAHLAERVAFDRRGAPVLDALHAGALWIAFGCACGRADAMVAFETRYAHEITSALTRSFEYGIASDAEQRLRDKLFLVGDGEVPRLASYSGRGDLRAWLRAAAVRMAIDLMRMRKMIPVDPADLGDAHAAQDPLLAALKQRYRDEFRVAFAGAAAELTDRERTLLRYRFLDGLSIDEIGRLCRAHRATVARWIAGIRETLFEGTRTRLMTQLAIDDSDVDSVLRLIDSELEVSIDTLLRAR